MTRLRIACVVCLHNCVILC